MLIIIDMLPITVTMVLIIINTIIVVPTFKRGNEAFMAAATSTGVQAESVAPPPPPSPER